MADIFVSYARADKARVAPLVAALKAQGWSIWWDPAITPGEEFDSLIRSEIDAASAVIVVWTPASIASRWVRGEARLGAERGILVPVRFERAQLPIDAMAIHTTDLDDWKEEAKSAAFQELLSALSRHLKNVPRAERRTSICVLPFANMSDDREQEYFADGISEDIITDLSKVRSLTVISRNSAFTFKGKHVDLPEVARQLKVSHVLEGSVRRSGNRVRITAQLIDGTTNGHVWAERYDRNLDDIFALQDEISQAIVAALKLKLLPEEKAAIQDRGTDNLEAYDKYLRARALYHHLGRSETMRAIEIFREALALDPNFGLAWFGLYSTLNYARAPFPEIAAEALKVMAEARERVEVLSPDAWWTRTLQGEEFALKRKWAEAEKAFREAVAIADVETLGGHARFLCNVGRVDEARRIYETIRDKDPLSPGISALLQAYLDFAHHPQEAQAEYKRSKDLAGNRAMAEHFALLRLMHRGDADPAAIKAQFAVMLQQENIAMPLNRIVADLLDEPKAALAAVRQAFDDPVYQHPSRLGQIAWYADYYGDKDLALAALRRSVVDMRSVTLYMLWRPTRTEMRKDPRFKDIVRDLGLVDYWKKSGKWGDFAQAKGDDDFEIIR